MTYLVTIALFERAKSSIVILFTVAVDVSGFAELKDRFRHENL